MAANRDRFKFIAAALNGDGVFRPPVRVDSDGKAIEVPSAGTTSALVPYPRESGEKFARRNQLAWYENHMASACKRYVGYLSKKPPMRDIKNTLLQAVADDCNWRGDAIGVFWQSFMREAKARGSMLLLVDMPESIPNNQADQEQFRAFPYFCMIHPECVTDYKLDERGRFESIEIDYKHDGELATKGWDKVKWWIRIGDRMVKTGDHNLGVCPVLAFTEDGDYPVEGEFAQIADMAKRLFNARSELDEILRAQTFSLLTYQVPPDLAEKFNATTVAQAIGTHNMVTYNGEMPGFIAPPDGPARVYLDTIGKIEEAIKRASLEIETPNGQTQESGVALAIRFQALNSSLTAFARRMEDFERRVWGVAAAWLKLSADQVTVQWAKDYAIADLATEMEVLGAMQAQGMPTEAIQAQMQIVVGLAFATLPNEQLQPILDAINNGSFEFTPTASTPTPPAVIDPNQPEPKEPPEPAAPLIDLTPLADMIRGLIESLQSAIKPPVVNVKVDAPVVNVAPPAITINAPESEAPAAAPIIINQPSGAKVIDLILDDGGNVTGATVTPQQ